MLALSISNVSKQFKIQQQTRPLLRKSMLPWLNNKIETDERIFWALKDINIKIKQGEVVGIIGPNGAGKSTLLKIISQILNPSEGRIEIFGRLGSILEVGMGFHPVFSGRDNINLSASIFGMTPDDLKKSFDQIVEFAEIGDFIDVPVKYYSSGMYMRLAFAVCAHLTHEILILDEVLAVGDAAFQRKCMGKMHDEMTSGRTVLFVSHNMSAIHSLCTRCIYIDKGKVVFDGDPGKAIAHYNESSSSKRSMRIWDDERTAPGNDRYRLRAVKLLDNEKNMSQMVDSDKDFYIEIEYQVLNDDTIMGETVAFFDSSNQSLFATLSNQEKEWHGIPRKKGIYRSNVLIPKDLFNKGVFYVTILLWSTGYTDPVRVDEAIELTVHDTGSIRNDYFGPMEGPFLPRLNWNTKHIGNAAS